jgi:hypothetical protein
MERESYEEEEESGRCALLCASIQSVTSERRIHAGDALTDLLKRRG